MFHRLQILWHKLFFSLFARIHAFKTALGQTTTPSHNTTEVTRHCNEFLLLIQDKQHSLTKQHEPTLKPQTSMIYLKISSTTFCRRWVHLQANKKVLEKDERTHTQNQCWRQLKTGKAQKMMASWGHLQGL